MAASYASTFDPSSRLEPVHRGWLAVESPGHAQSAVCRFRSAAAAPRPLVRPSQHGRILDLARDVAARDHEDLGTPDLVDAP
jgi:hypothetical protein